MRATVESPGLNLRVQPNVSARVKYALNHDDVVVLMGQPNKWGWQMVKVERTGDYGYVDAHYLRIFMEKKPLPPPETTTTVEQPPPLKANPIDNDGGPNKDTGTMIVTIVIMAAILGALYWTLLAGKSL